MTPDIEAIKKRLADFPDLPWLASDIIDNGGGGVITSSNKIIVKSGLGMELSRLIARAPTDIAELVEEVEQLRERLNRQK